ncbi:MAG: superoxide dismutase family protein [Myxococcales bacterium]|nr:superoxide dismutase family protein [Myxococcales bacterium]
MKKTVAAIGLLVAAIGLAGEKAPKTAPGAAPKAPPPSGAAATAELKDAQGKVVGTATLRQTQAGLLVSVDIFGVPSGPHAFHIHETGKCEPPFKSAGAHFNPAGHQHGFENPKGAHGGDMPNLFVPADGKLKAEVITTSAALDEKLFDADGAALVIHATSDDYRTDPAGAAGDRIACGIILRR